MKTYHPESRAAIWINALLAISLVWGTHPVRAGGGAADEVSRSIRPEAIRADMRFLADDLLEGRQTGTRGHEIAANFMAAEFEAMGLEPAGENGTYFQKVPLRSTRPDEEHTTLSFVQGGKKQTIIFRQDFLTYGDPGLTDTSVEAPVVYVGFGVTAPEQGYDDYAGVDVRGKVAPSVYGAPPQFESTMRAHYSSRVTKAANAVAHGAVGTISLDSPVLEQLYPFKDRVSDLAFSDMHWLDARGQTNDYFPELRLQIGPLTGSSWFLPILAGSGYSILAPVSVLLFPDRRA